VKDVDALILIIAYVLGSIPSAYLIGKIFAKKDITKVGSGNVGTVNAIKNIGFLPGVLTFILDAAKAIISVAIAKQFSKSELIPYFASFFVILGHNFSIFLKFKGGKGLACLVGILLVISPITIIYLFGFIGILTLAFGKKANAATGVGIFILPVILYYQHAPTEGVIVSFLISLLVMYKNFDYIKDFLKKET
jgi:glycerol-3-phosphate acyltransferase PlsY